MKKILPTLSQFDFSETNNNSLPTLIAATPSSDKSNNSKVIKDIIIII